MIKNPDGTVTFTELEAKSLSKVVTACRDAISSLVSDGDFLGWDNYRALQMWEDKLRYKSCELSDYIDDGKPSRIKKVDAWLDKYGKSQ